MTTQPDHESDPRPRVIVEFNEAETAQVHMIAEWYAKLCIDHGAPPPPDAMRAIVCACLLLHDRVAMLEAVVEAAGITPTDYVPNAPKATLQ